MESAGARRATFTAMQSSTRTDWEIIGSHYMEYARGLPGRVLAHLGELAGDNCGFPIDRLTHSLLSATLAHAGGEDEEYVVCALLHDIGDTLGPWNHPEIAVAILRPYVSEANVWMIEKHAILQGYHFFHHVGLDRNLRDRLRDSPHYERTARFVDLYDNPAFDPGAECLPLEFFAPMVERVLASPKRSLYHGQPDEAPPAEAQAGSR